MALCDLTQAHPLATVGLSLGLGASYVQIGSGAPLVDEHLHATLAALPLALTVQQVPVADDAPRVDVCPRGCAGRCVLVLLSSPYSLPLLLPFVLRLLVAQGAGGIRVRGAGGPGAFALRDGRAATRGGSPRRRAARRAPARLTPASPVPLPVCGLCPRSAITGGGTRS